MSNRCLFVTFIRAKFTFRFFFAFAFRLPPPSSSESSPVGRVARRGLHARVRSVFAQRVDNARGRAVVVGLFCAAGTSGIRLDRRGGGGCRRARRAGHVARKRGEQRAYAGDAVFDEMLGDIFEQVATYAAAKCIAAVPGAGVRAAGGLVWRGPPRIEHVPAAHAACGGCRWGGALRARSARGAVGTVCAWRSGTRRPPACA